MSTPSAEQVQRRPAKMVTALRVDLDTQAALEQAAADLVAANRDSPAQDHIGELMRHLDAARHAARLLGNRAAT